MLGWAGRLGLGVDSGAAVFIWVSLKSLASLTLRCFDSELCRLLRSVREAVFLSLKRKQESRSLGKRAESRKKKQREDECFGRTTGARVGASAVGLRSGSGSLLCM